MGNSGYKVAETKKEILEQLDELPVERQAGPTIKCPECNKTIKTEHEARVFHHSDQGIVGWTTSIITEPHKCLVWKTNEIAVDIVERIVSAVQDGNEQ